MAAFFDRTVPIPRGVGVSPGAVLDFSEDWTAWLGADNTTSVVWAIPTGLTLVLQQQVGKVMTVWLSGFERGRTYELACTVTTDTTPARVDTRCFILPCKRR